MPCYNLFNNCDDKDIDSGKLVKLVTAHWHWNKFSGEVICSNCKAVVGVCFSEATLIQLKDEQLYCYNCGAKMNGGKDNAET